MPICSALSLCHAATISLALIHAATVTLSLFPALFTTPNTLDTLRHSRHSLTLTFAAGRCAPGDARGGEARHPHPRHRAALPVDLQAGRAQQDARGQVSGRGEAGGQPRPRQAPDLPGQSGLGVGGFGLRVEGSARLRGRAREVIGREADTPRGHRADAYKSGALTHVRAVFGHTGTRAAC